jgi:ABC-type antimicrobial peptide transport system permease subunit
LVGVAGAVVLTAAAGARRTSTAFPRLLGDGHAAQVGAAPNGDGRGYYDALALFAALAGLVALAVVGQLLGRQVIMESSDYHVLSALGMDRRQLFGLALLRASLVSLAGGGIAAGMAVAASPLMPIGPARLAEPDPGVEVNLAILGPGLLAIAVLPLLIIAPVAWHAARAGATPGRGPATSPRPSWLASSLARLGGSPAATVGVRMVFEPGRGRSAVPARTALAGTTAAVAALVFALCMLTQVLIGSTRRRRRDLALVKVLGFVRRQVWATVAREATTLVTTALLVGLPLGVAGGRWAWALFAQSAGIQPGAAVPLGALLLAVPVAVLLANIIAAGPAWQAARIKSAAALQAE